MTVFFLLSQIWKIFEPWCLIKHILFKRNILKKISRKNLSQIWKFLRKKLKKWNLIFFLPKFGKFWTLMLDKIFILQKKHFEKKWSKSVHWMRLSNLKSGKNNKISIFSVTNLNNFFRKVAKLWNFDFVYPKFENFCQKNWKKVEKWQHFFQKKF